MQQPPLGQYLLSKDVDVALWLDFRMYNEDPPLDHAGTSAFAAFCTTKTRLPITIPLLHTIKQQLSTADLPAHDKLLYWAAFYGFLRASEYSCPTRRKYRSSTHLLLDNITIDRNSLSACLKRPKTDRFGKSARVLIGATGSYTCPVRAMRKFLAVRRLQPPGPLFILSSGHFLTRSDISRTTKHLILSTAGINPGPYSSHS